MVGELESSMHGTMREALAADARLEELMALARDAVDWEAWPADVGYERHTRKFRPARTLSGPAIRLSYQRHTTAQGREVFLFQPQLRSKWGGSVKLGLFSVVRDREGCFLVALGGPGEVGPSHTSHWILGFVDGAGDMPDILTYTGPDGRVGDVHVFRWRYDSDMTSWERALVMQRDDFWGLKYPDAAGRVELRYRPKTEVRVASYDPATGAVEDHLLPPEDK